MYKLLVDIPLCHLPHLFPGSVLSVAPSGVLCLSVGLFPPLGVDSTACDVYVLSPPFCLFRFLC